MSSAAKAWNDLLADRDKLRTELAEAKKRIAELEVERNQFHAERDAAIMQRSEMGAQRSLAELNVKELEKERGKLKERCDCFREARDLYFTDWKKANTLLREVTEGDLCEIDCRKEDSQDGSGVDRWYEIGGELAGRIAAFLKGQPAGPSVEECLECGAAIGGNRDCAACRAYNNALLEGSE